MAQYILFRSMKLDLQETIGNLDSSGNWMNNEKTQRFKNWHNNPAYMGVLESLHVAPASNCTELTSLTEMTSLDPHYCLLR